MDVDGVDYVFCTRGIETFQFSSQNTSRHTTHDSTRVIIFYSSCMSSRIQQEYVHAVPPQAAFRNNQY